MQLFVQAEMNNFKELYIEALEVCQNLIEMEKRLTNFKERAYDYFSVDEPLTISFLEIYDKEKDTSIVFEELLEDSLDSLEDAVTFAVLWMKYGDIVITLLSSLQNPSLETLKTYLDEYLIDSYLSRGEFLHLVCDWTEHELDTCGDIDAATEEVIKDRKFLELKVEDLYYYFDCYQSEVLV